MNLTTIIWIIVIVVSLLVIWGISFVVLVFLMKKTQKKAFKALDDLVPYERERFDIILETVEQLKKENKFRNKEMDKLVEEQKKLLEGVTIDMSKVKAQNDFLILYLRKLLKDKGLKMKDPYKDLNKKMEEHFFDDTSSKNSPYYNYSKLALRYNAYMGMMFVASYANRKGYPRAPIL